MKKISFKDTAVTVVILCVVFIICLIIQDVFKTEVVIPSVYILGVFLISVLTNGYVYGIASSIISAVAVNFAFTFPYFKIDFTIQKIKTVCTIMQKETFAVNEHGFTWFSLYLLNNLDTNILLLLLKKVEPYDLIVILSANKYDDDTIDFHYNRTDGWAPTDSQADLSLAVFYF